MKTFRESMAFAVFICLVCSTSVPMPISGHGSSKVELNEVLSISLNNVPIGSSLRQVLALAISPDNESLVSVLRATLGSETITWIGRWTISDRQLVAQQNLPPSEKAVIRFTPDGKILTVSTETATSILDGRSLNILGSTPSNNASLYWSALSPDGSSLAEMRVVGSEGSIHIYDLPVANERTHWTKPNGTDYPLPTSLSLRGDQILFISPAQGNDIELIDSRDGKTVRRFASGFRFDEQSSAKGVGGAFIIDSSHLIAVPTDEADAKGKYVASEMRIIELGSGESTVVLKDSHLAAPSRYIWLSKNRDSLATMSAWRTPSQNFSDQNVRLRYLIFRFDRSGPICRVPRLPVSDLRLSTTELITEPSYDLKLLSIDLGTRIAIFEIKGCDF